MNLLNSLCLIILLISSSSIVSGSIGDRSPEYRLCVSSCFQDSCSILPDPQIPRLKDDGTVTSFDPDNLPWSLRLTRWDCKDDCRYHCTHRVTNEAQRNVERIKHALKSELEEKIQSDALKLSSTEKKKLLKESLEERLKKLRKVEKEMVQYHGKWVFVRILGAQEPFSVLFSLANLLVNLFYFFKISRSIPDSFPLKAVYQTHCFIAVNSWIWSSLFHTRDKDFTEKADYFSAGASVLSSFFFTFTRVFTINPDPDKSRFFKSLVRICAIAFLLHVAYLSWGRFDYAYNMIANISVGIAQSTLWLVYSLKSEWFHGVFAGENSTRDAKGKAEVEEAERNQSHSTSISTSTFPCDATESGSQSQDFASRSNSLTASSNKTSNSILTQSNVNPHVNSGDSVPTSPSSLPLSSEFQGSQNSFHSRSRSPSLVLPSSLRLRLQMLLLLTILSTSLELFDFAPIYRMIDAHSLWHLSTVPLTYFWYEFLISDAQNLVSTGFWVDEELRIKREKRSRARRDFQKRIFDTVKGKLTQVKESRRVKQASKIVKSTLGNLRDEAENRGWDLDPLDRFVRKSHQIFNLPFAFVTPGKQHQGQSGDQDRDEQESEEEIPLNRKISI